jgi:hypothetical protein
MALMASSASGIFSLGTRRTPSVRLMPFLLNKPKHLALVLMKRALSLSSLMAPM